MATSSHDTDESIRKHAIISGMGAAHKHHDQAPSESATNRGRTDGLDECDSLEPLEQAASANTLRHWTSSHHDPFMPRRQQRQLQWPERLLGHTNPNRRLHIWLTEASGAQMPAIAGIKEIFVIVQFRMLILMGIKTSVSASRVCRTSRWASHPTRTTKKHQCTARGWSMLRHRAPRSTHGAGMPKS